MNSTSAPVTNASYASKPVSCAPKAVEFHTRHASVTSSPSTSSTSQDDLLALLADKCACCFSNANKPASSNVGVANKAYKRDYRLSFNQDDTSDDDTMTPTSPCSEEEHDDVEPVHDYMSPKPQQSPIDICTMNSRLERMTPGSISVSLCEGEAEIFHSGPNFEIRWQSEERSSLLINGKVYYAVQFHFHTPSEHTINGKHEAMEMHMVHKAEDGALAVVAMFIREGAENPFLAQFWDKLPGVDANVHNKASLGKITPLQLDLVSGNFFRYQGSLTTPPFTEGVEWIVLGDVAEASSEQIDTFISTIPSPNARPVQALNKRIVSLVL